MSKLEEMDEPRERRKARRGRGRGRLNQFAKNLDVTWIAGEVDMGETIIRQHHNTCRQQKAPSPWRSQCLSVKLTVSFRVIQQRANDEILTGYPAISK